MLMPKIRQLTVKVFVQHFSLETMHEAGWEMGDNGFQSENTESFIHNDWLLQCLTRRQQAVTALLADGYTRKETAKQLGVSWQAIHQIVLRMRKRLREKGGITWKK